MKLLIALWIMLIPNLVLAATQTLNCGTDMYQFKSDQKMFPLIGDSNQRLLFSLEDNGSGELFAEAKARFLNDQSADHTNSLYGVEANATYSENSGLFVSMRILKFESKDDQAKSELIAGVASSGDYTRSLKEIANDLSFAYINPKAFDPRIDLWTLIKNGSVTDYELYSVIFNGCWIESSKQDQ